MSQEVIEDGISTIELSVSAFSSRVFNPKDGRAKWFKDEIGQKWVKFTTENLLSDNKVLTDHVWPADLVIEVCYVKIL